MITRPVVSMSLGLEIFIHFFLSTLRLPSGSGHGVLRLLRSRVGTVGHPMERRPFRKCPPQERPRPGTHPLRQGEYTNILLFPNGKPQLAPPLLISGQTLLAISADVVILLSANDVTFFLGFRILSALCGHNQRRSGQTGTSGIRPGERRSRPTDG